MSSYNLSKYKVLGYDIIKTARKCNSDVLDDPESIDIISLVLSRRGFDIRVNLWVETNDCPSGYCSARYFEVHVEKIDYKIDKNDMQFVAIDEIIVELPSAGLTGISDYIYSGYLTEKFIDLNIENDDWYPSSSIKLNKEYFKENKQARNQRVVYLVYGSTIFKDEFKNKLKTFGPIDILDLRNVPKKDFDKYETFTEDYIIMGDEHSTYDVRSKLYNPCEIVVICDSF